MNVVAVSTDMLVAIQKSNSAGVDAPCPCNINVHIAPFIPLYWYSQQADVAGVLAALAGFLSQHTNIQRP